MMFCATFVVLVTWSLVFNSKGSHVPRTCDSPQYLELRRPATIHCTFQEGFYSVLWYNTSVYIKSDPIIRYSDLLKSGYGYESGEFDVYSNGSLIIKNVSVRHEGIYTAAYLHNSLQNPIITQIRVVVMAKPDISFPHIFNCGNNSTVCYYKGDSPVRCSIQDVRPNITLAWMARTLNEDKVILNDVVATRGTIGYTFRVTTTDFFHYSPLLALLVCKASSRLNVLQKYESMILVENPSLNFSSTKRTQRYVERGSMLELTCTYDATAFVIWKKATTFDGSQHEDLLYSIFVGEKHSEVYVDNINVDGNGSLIVYQVDVKHEGIYFCVFGNGLTNGWITYDVKVRVPPVPAYPVVEGCDHQKYCVIEASHEGSLTCLVKGIRPRVELKWKTFRKSEAELISFTNHESTIQSDGETFDVSQKASYYIKDKSRDRLTIECGTSESEESFHLTTKVDLIFKVDFHPTNSPVTHSNIPWIITVSVSVLSLLLCGKIIQQYTCKNIFNLRSTHKDEATISSTLLAKIYDSGTLPYLKELFVSQIKEKYKDWYDAVQPIPYIKDRLYCVDKVFVEGGIEFLDSIEGVGGRGTWKTLETYENLFNASLLSSPRRILEGEPGYGKSTVTLQFAYDWCNLKETSALKDVEILILLRLRQLGGVPSIYKAIQRFILPRDTTISETDIEHILRNSKSVVVILDGFDEYPDQDSATITDVMTIIARQMFQNFEVVTTTRSSFLPKKYPPLTKRIRLTGFDDKARRYYIRKAVVGDDDEGVRKIEGYLEDNPILSDLCQVPLLFVIFAHMTYESEQFRKLNSVTSFFRYMISCFHSHMRNKMEDENVRKYELFETDHRDLDKLAFEAFSGQSQRIIWDKDEMCQLVGREFYDQYIRIGILVEEESVDIIDDPGTPITEHVQYKKEVRFYHKLFCEWYAAHYLVDYLQRNPTLDLGEFLRHLDPFDVQYLYRFACGINSDSAEKIIDYLKNIDGGDKFAILCILEQTGKIDNIKETICQLCYDGVLISGYDTLLLQRSSMQLLEIAARCEIPIEWVTLSNCLQSVDLSTVAIRTTSGLALTSRIPVKWLEVDLYNRDMTEDEAIDILQFASMCPSLRLLVYFGCVPPRVFTNNSTLSSLKSRDVEVWWYWRKDGTIYSLNLQTGRWENKNGGSEPTEEDFERMLSKGAETRKSWTEEMYKGSVSS
ncbi:NLR family CARD domain-containing protein 4 [Holothuria leucospilota]|uniref:NLR family CARD domain-containing protein 4 n=1 Tax=Holothuria leucospilota TaxID=206669 RepID=A0A9Q1BBY5_HOLLE|nr:NLR family CARD domain-containing protein 4 [Holothuria leucospilota]